MLSRRGIFGLFAGAAVAGPSIAAAAARPASALPLDVSALDAISANLGEVIGPLVFPADAIMISGAIRAELIDPAMWQISLNADGSVDGLRQLIGDIDTQGCA